MSSHPFACIVRRANGCWLATTGAQNHRSGRVFHGHHRLPAAMELREAGTSIAINHSSGLSRRSAAHVACRCRCRCRCRWSATSRFSSKAQTPKDCRPLSPSNTRKGMSSRTLIRPQLGVVRGANGWSPPSIDSCARSKTSWSRRLKSARTSNRPRGRRRTIG